ncbi:MAG: UDP-N-acetylmuramoyl-L-alanyl-D-glutamate--2,6-diaminopimelate ligase [Proteobacteria bacterium]|nr:UDP-N-acetylmuramoyl-L-alanyl-D-glutamate--2,6-diaminopimelate ligase [Pseudomonadota bacterium]
MSVVPRPIRALQPLLEGIARVEHDCELTDITQDSRAASAGCAFLACAGRTTHGLRFATQAVERGARAILWEPALNAPAVPEFHSDIIVTPVDSLSVRAGEIADRFFGAPSAQLAVTGVTGTNGKTTTAYLLAQLWTAFGSPAAYLGTIGTGLPGALTGAALTTADAVTVQRSLAEMLRLGARHVIMEVSSHALDQGRVNGVRFRTAMFSNLSRDHLDYHSSMDAYAAAKARLFERPELTARIINIDDEFGAQLASRAAQPGHLLVTSRRQQASLPGRTAMDARYVRAVGLVSDARGLTIAIESSWGNCDLQTPLIGAFNIDNVLLALAALLDGGVELPIAAGAFRHIEAPPGRMQRFGATGTAPLVLVDYAHTPDALANALRAARAHCTGGGKLWVVFGCGGDRDVGKRPLMGAIAQQLADAIVLTDDNPRGESPSEIIAAIRTGMQPPAVTSTDLLVLHDRRVAIATTLERATAKDVVLVAGKGHEDYQLYGSERRAFSDAAVIRDLLGAVAGVSA